MHMTRYGTGMTRYRTGMTRYRTYLVIPIPYILFIRRRAVTSVTIGYQGGWSKRLGLPSYQVTSRYWSYVDV